MGETRADEMGSQAADDAASKYEPGYLTFAGQESGFSGASAPDILLNAKVRLKDGLGDCFGLRLVHAGPRM